MKKNKFDEYQLALDVIGKELTLKNFSLIIGKSYRQAQRIVKAVREKDYSGVLHGNKGKKPVNKISEALENKVIGLFEKKYSHLSLAQFRKSILINEGIDIKKTTLEKWAKKHGLNRVTQDIVE